MTHHIATWFDLPVTDMARAKRFYSSVFNVRFKDDEKNGLQMAMFESDPEAVSGMLVKADCYQPNATGTVVYFNGGADLSLPLARAEAEGAQLIVPKTPINDGACGYFAILIDCEGNRIGLYSPQ